MSKTITELLVGVLQQVGATKRSGKDRTLMETTTSARMADGVVPVNEQMEFLGRLAGQSVPPTDVKIQTVMMGFINHLEPIVRDRMLLDGKD